MATVSMLFRLSKIAAAIVLIASCTLSTASPSATVCDGVSSELGGCTATRHDFTASTCTDLAKEWATTLDAPLVSILKGPAAVADQGRSVLVRQALVITTADLNQRLQSLNLQAGCDISEFMAAAEPIFSAELRQEVGDALYGGNPPATYEDWLDDVRRVARTIDEEE